MSTTNWEALEKEMGGNHKNFYADGEYEAKCVGIEIKEVGQNGSTVMKFAFDDGGEGQFPTADHWLSWKNEGWRKWHNRCLMMVLGATKDAAQKAVDVCESKDGKESITKAYETTFKKLLAKKPTVKVEVYTENKYARSEFLDRSVAMPHGNEKQAEPKSDDVLAGAEEVTDEADLDSLPF